MAKPNPITQALRSAIMHSTEPMVLSDPALPDHPMIEVNAAFETLSGYARADTVGRNCRFLQGEKTDARTPARIRRCIAEQHGCIEWIVNYRRDGTVFWNLLFLSPVFTPDGTLLHYFGNQRDITEGPPVELPDYSLGKADMPLQGEAEFHSLLLRTLTDGADGPATAGTLQQLVETARRLNDITTRLTPAPWSPDQ